LWCCRRATTGEATGRACLSLRGALHARLPHAPPAASVEFWTERTAVCVQADTHAAKRHAASTAAAAAADAAVTSEAAAASDGDARLVGMRKAMAAAAGGKGLDAYIVPTDDPHQSEYDYSRQCIGLTLL
jgi:hypothetical protein